MAETSRTHWKMAAPLALVIVLMFAWSGYWYWSLGRVKAGFSQFERDVAARGGALACNEESWGGFPFRLTLTCSRLVLRLTARGATFETARVEALAQAYAPNHVIAIAEGPSRLGLHDGPVFDLAHKPMTASFRLRSGGRAEAALVVEDTVLSADGAVVARGRSLELHARNEGPETVEFGGRGDGVLVEPGIRPAVQVARVAFRGAIDNLPPGFAAMPGDLLTAAATSGARVRLDVLEAEVEGSTVEGSGAVALGADGFPDGSIAMRLGDLDRLLKSLQDRGIIDRRAEKAGSLLLGLLLGKKERASLDLTFRDGRIFWGPFKLLEHGPIR